MSLFHKITKKRSCKKINSYLIPGLQICVQCMPFSMSSKDTSIIFKDSGLRFSLTLAPLMGYIQKNENSIIKDDDN